MVYLWGRIVMIRVAAIDLACSVEHVTVIVTLKVVSGNLNAFICSLVGHVRLHFCESVHSFISPLVEVLAGTHNLAHLTKVQIANTGLASTLKQGIRGSFTKSFL